MNHKVFDGCVINILSDYKKDYFPGDFRTGISFVLDKLNGTWHRFRNYRDTSRLSWLWMSAQRSSPCIIFLLDNYALQWYPHLIYALYGLAHSNLDPHFILLYSRFPGSHLLPTLRSHSYYVSSTILLWYQFHKTFFRICLSVRDPIPLTMDHQSSRDSLRLIPPMEKSFGWISHVGGSPPSAGREELLSCSTRYWGLATRFSTCTAYVLSTHYNYSLTMQYKGERSFAHASVAEWIGKAFYKGRFPARSVRKMQLLNYATHYLEFTLVLYTGQGGSLDFVKLLEPLDTWIWVGLGIGFLLMFVCILGFSEKREGIGGALFKVFSVMLDQSQHSPEGGKVVLDKVTILITTWTVTLSIISTCYKGDLLSYFVMETPPSTPDTLEALDRSGIMVTTNSWYKAYVGKLFNVMVLSTLKEDILPDLADGEDPLAEFYTRLNSSMILLTGEVGPVVANISRNKPGSTDRGLVQIPATFAALDDETGSKRMKFLISRNTDYVIQEKKIVGRINSLSRRVPWYMNNVEYAGMIKNGLARLWESGIYSNWLRNMDVHRTIEVLKANDKLENSRGLNYYGILVMSGKDLIAENQFSAHFAPVKVHNLKICFIVFGVGVGVGLLYWLGEGRKIVGRRIIEGCEAVYLLLQNTWRRAL
ncbi:hypothetical protein Fcan01_27858 [Folsomia candida]|uniref:Uncharacterized protein n=1 Tax=Folsomia candida TaxID=158441 RepID=A0A226CY10_FOLCA|nr:hypothetical protein Fcan01_27858 [Folsomia candida]